METIDDAHSFLLDAEPTETIKTHREILEDLSSLTMECAYLVRDYAVDKSFCKPGYNRLVPYSKAIAQGEGFPTSPF